MTDWVRVQHENGSEVSVTPERAKLTDRKPLDKPAARNGQALLPKFDPLNTKKKTAKAAAETSEKENAS